jgi:hypothetical protein
MEYISFDDTTQKLMEGPFWHPYNSLFRKECSLCLLENLQ